MNKDLGKYRQRNATRTGQTKQDVNDLIDLVEQLHHALLFYGCHRGYCEKRRSIDVTQPCVCGLDALMENETVQYDFRAHIHRKQGEDIPLTAIYER